ncbi:YusU family protein [Fictibacillus terranigra]|uniref:YusU family protein n=1 Tax=Fictibacillus terranigra TaxID=3058424 RepID=A0ABT8E323_9BACL|nr:YusU family protein [Fictibacillus sp. CENA-BCM004]MDN4072297.1 YusU family protein [Fictibacillus sp. CENA-BCM004]
MEQQLREQFDGLLEKYTELLLGDSDEDKKEKVKMWALYTYIAKSMPALVKHWNESYPEGKEGIKEIISEIKQLNDQQRQKSGE